LEEWIRKIYDFITLGAMQLNKEGSIPAGQENGMQDIGL
jgi:hypothetical protein